jgi:hypothetical protein
MMMQQASQSGLKSMLAEASLALAHLDAERLEEMALSCAALTRDVQRDQCDKKGQYPSGFGEAAPQMELFARVLEATRVNLKVMRRLREVRAARLEYRLARGGGDAFEEVEHGDH